MDKAPPSRSCGVTVTPEVLEMTGSLGTRTEPKVGRSFVISHASFSHVSPVTLFIAWVVAAFRKRDFKKLQRKQGTSMRREVSSEATHGEVALSTLRWHLVMLLQSGHTLRQGWTWGLYPDGM